MIVEVIGLPAVGKTTLIDANFHDIMNSYKIVSSRTYSVMNSILTRLYYHFFYKNLCQDKKLAHKISYRMSFRTFLWEQQNYFFYDSGIYQVLVESLIENNFENITNVQKILAKVRCADEIIYIKASVQEAAEREIKRRERRYPALEKDDLLKRYAVLEEMIVKKELFAGANISIVTASEFMPFLNGLKNKK